MTLASEYKQATPERPGPSQKQLNRGSVSDTLPPTLLRLPNLDPAPPAAAYPESELRERESLTPNLPNSTEHHPQAVSASLPINSDSVAPTPSQTTPAGQTTPAQNDAPSATSLLVHFASRKTLVALLLLIAGLAIFLPRSSESGLETPPSSAAKSDTSDLPKHNPPAATVAENLPRIELAPAANPMLIQQPDSDDTPGTAVPLRRPFASQLASSPSGLSNPSEHGNPLSDFQADAATSFSAATNMPDFDSVDDDAVTASLAAAANEEIRRMDAARSAAEQPPEEDSPVAAKPDFVQSRTPNPITNWVTYLPLIDSQSFASDSAMYQPVVDPQISEQVRTTGMPGEPDFRFALPEGAASGDPAQESGSASQANPTKGASVVPEARVAMPPSLGYPDFGGMNR